MKTATTTQPLEWSELWSAMRDNWETGSDEWTPTSEAMYWNQLEVLPPAATKGPSFLVGEAWNHDASGRAVHSCFTERPDGYFARYMTIAEFRQAAP